MSTERRYEHFINGEWVPPSSGEYFDSTNPATLDVLYRAARGNEADVDRAVSAASAAFENPSLAGPQPDQARAPAPPSR